MGGHCYREIALKNPLTAALFLRGFRYGHSLGAWRLYFAATLRSVTQEALMRSKPGVSGAW